MEINQMCEVEPASVIHDLNTREAPAYVMWKQRDGALIRVIDMDDGHLYNTIKMLERNADARAKRENEKQFSTDPDVPFYELTREQCLARPVYHALVDVAKARGIDLTYEVCTSRPSAKPLRGERTPCSVGRDSASSQIGAVPALGIWVDRSVLGRPLAEG